jgi:hypothetical protein
MVFNISQGSEEHVSAMAPAVYIMTTCALANGRSANFSLTEVVQLYKLFDRSKLQHPPAQWEGREVTSGEGHAN